MTTESRLSFGRLIGGIAVLVAIGIPLVAYLWETLNRAMAGYYDLIRVLVALPVLLVFLVFIRYVAALVVRWERHEID